MMTNLAMAELLAKSAQEQREASLRSEAARHQHELRRLQERSPSSWLTSPVAALVALVVALRNSSS